MTFCDFEFRWARASPLPSFLSTFIKPVPYKAVVHRLVDMFIGLVHFLVGVSLESSAVRLDRLTNGVSDAPWVRC